MKLAALWLGVGSIDCGGIVAQPEPARRHSSTKSAEQPRRLHVSVPHGHFRWPLLK
jgi:hypothetical protein